MRIMNTYSIFKLQDSRSLVEKATLTVSMLFRGAIYSVDFLLIWKHFGSTDMNPNSSMGFVLVSFFIHAVELVLFCDVFLDHISSSSLTLSCC